MKYFFILILVVTSVSFAASYRIRDTNEGCFIERIDGAGYDRSARFYTLDDPQVLWSRHETEPIFESVAIDSVYAYSGSELNDPKEASWYDVVGDGVPGGSIFGTEWEVATNGEYWAAVDFDDPEGAKLYYMFVGSVDPIWTYTLGAGSPANTDGLQFSRDGNRLILCFDPASTPIEVYSWQTSAADSVPEYQYESSPEYDGVGRVLACSNSADVVAFKALAMIHVIDVENQTLRGIVDAGASTDALAISAEGDIIVSAFTMIRAWEWTGTDYEQIWQLGGNSRYASVFQISPDDGYLATGWRSQNNSRVYLKLYEIETGATIWEYAYNPGSAEFQNMIWDLDISDDANWIAVGEWGNALNSTPEAAVFSRWYPTPYYELDMPGSCFSIDLNSDGRYMIAGGKSVHANSFGRGGDVYCVDLDLPPIEPIAGLLSDSIAASEVICQCSDTVTFFTTLFNRGYAPLQIEGVTWLEPDTLNERYLEIDSSLLNLEILPGDTVDFGITIAICEELINEPPFAFEIQTTDTILPVLFHAEVAYCDPAEWRQTAAPIQFGLNPVYPNPFNSSATLQFELPGSSVASLDVFDIQGRHCEQLLNGQLSAGTHALRWNASDFASGIYLLRLETSFGIATQKAVLLK